MANRKVFEGGDLKLVATRIQEKLLADITDRRGWRQEWDQFDDGVQEEIKRKHREIILRELESYPTP